MKAICVLLVLVAITSLATEQAPPIELVLRTPQTAYAIGDPIPVSLLIRARDPSQLSIGKMLFGTFMETLLS